VLALEIRNRSIERKARLAQFACDQVCGLCTKRD
jgi:hypothetical protein